MTRFFWVAAPTGSVAHMSPARRRQKRPIEGDLMFCGRFLPLGWRWLRSRFRGLRKGPAPVCMQCLHAFRGIAVARVR